MINYSLTMRPVNANLIEINRAKSRINAAKAAGEEPQAEDIALVATEVQKAFAQAQFAEVMTIEKFARHIADHGCVYSRADISAILYMAVDCMREQLLDGKKIRLGDLGDFSVNITSRGADSTALFTTQYITGLNVQWDCGPQFRNLMAEAEFQLVPTRAQQAALIRAIRSGSAVAEDPSDTQQPSDTQEPSDSGNDDTGSGGDGGSGDGPSFTSPPHAPHTLSPSFPAQVFPHKDPRAGFVCPFQKTAACFHIPLPYGELSVVILVFRGCRPVAFGFCMCARKRPCQSLPHSRPHGC